MLFSKVIGHATLKAKLIGNIREGRVAHAQLFMGPRGSWQFAHGAGLCALSAVSQSEAVDACGKCPSCLHMAKLEHPDLHLMFPIFISWKRSRRPVSRSWPNGGNSVLATPYLDVDQWREQLESENKQLRMGVDIAQEIQRKLSLRSFMGGYKVMLIWLPELMDGTAANKLLKVLEEPEPNTVFLLVSTDAGTTACHHSQPCPTGTHVPALRPS